MKLLRRRVLPRWIYQLLLSLQTIIVSWSRDSKYVLSVEASCHFVLKFKTSLFQIYCVSTIDCLSVLDDRPSGSWPDYGLFWYTIGRHVVYYTPAWPHDGY